MKYLYYCNSTYQLINILNLHWHRQNANFEDIDNYSADLILLNTFEGYNGTINQLKEIGSFEKIWLVDRYKIEGKFHLFETVSNIVYPGQYLKRAYRITKEEVKDKYDYLVLPKFSKITAAIWQLNKNAKLQFHEDGLGTYDMFEKLIELKRTYKYLYKLFNYGRSFSQISSIYLSMPEMFNYQFNGEIKRLPKYNVDYLNLVKQYFGKYISVAGEENKQICWFSQTLFNDTSYEIADKTLDYLNNYYDKVIFYPHPRFPVENKNKFYEPIKKQIWELKVLEIKNIDKKCLIAVHSTALFTPYMLYKYEPYLIFIYKFINLDDEEDIRKLDRMTSILRNRYTNPEKIMVPENFEEFKKCLDNYLNAIEEK